MQPLKFPTAHFHGMEAAFDRYKEERWTGIIQRPVDCLSILYSIEDYSLIEAKEALERDQRNAPKAHQGLYGDVIAAFARLAELTERKDLIYRLNELINLWHNVNDRATNAQIAFTHNMNDARKRSRSSRIWACWKEMQNAFYKVQLTEISAEEARALRLDLTRPIVTGSIEPSATWGTTTLYNAFLAQLHAGPTKPYRLHVDGIQPNIVDLYSGLAKAKSSDERKTTVYGYLKRDFSYINYNEDLMEAVFHVLEDWKRTLMSAIDKVLAFENVNGPNMQAQSIAIVTGDEEMQYHYWIRDTYANALDRLWKCIVIVEEK